MKFLLLFSVFLATYLPQIRTTACDEWVNMVSTTSCVKYTLFYVLICCGRDDGSLFKHRYMLILPRINSKKRAVLVHPKYNIAIARAAPLHGLL